MTPGVVRFSCRAEFAMSPEDVSARVIDVDRWSDFRGWGPLPGIRKAEFIEKTGGVLGSRVRVENTDGSTHVEEIAEWDPGRRVALRMDGFGPPLSRLAESFYETLDLEAAGGGTLMVRSFEMVPTGMMARPLLVVISWMLKKAVERQNRELGGQ